MGARNTGILLAAALLGATAGSARAGFITIKTDIVNQGDVYAYAVPEAGSLSITGSSSEVPSFALWGTTDSDPTLTVVERLTNNTSAAWDSYSITLTPDPQYVVTNLVRDVLMPTNLFANWSTSLDGQTINFFGGSVPVGQQLVAMFDFDITDISGQFSYHIANLPHSASAPEPTSLAMVGLGAALLLRRRR